LKKSKITELTLCDFKTYYKARVTKTVEGLFWLVSVIQCNDRCIYKREAGGTELVSGHVTTKEVAKIQGRSVNQGMQGSQEAEKAKEQVSLELTKGTNSIDTLN
jgi:hypothetical protein